MKEAKEQFDSLVQRIKDRDSVQFGEMEESFARAFLSEFLNKIQSKESRKSSYPARNTRIKGPK